MGLLLMMYRKLSLTRRKNNVEYKLTDLNQKLTDLQHVSGTLSSDNVTLTDLAGMPPSLFQSGVASLSQAHAYGQQYANSIMGMYGTGDNSVFNQYGPYAQQMMNVAYMKAYEQGRNQYSKQQMAEINDKENQIQQEKVKLEAELSTIDEEMKALDQRMPQEVSSSVAHYGLGGN